MVQRDDFAKGRRSRGRVTRGAAPIRAATAGRALWLRTSATMAPPVEAMRHPSLPHRIDPTGEARAFVHANEHHRTPREAVCGRGA